MKLCLTSDLHGHLPDLPEVDLILIGGDICPQTLPSAQARWLDTEFRSWLKSLKGQVIGVAGNHDFIFQDAPDLVPRLPWTYLQDSEVKVGNLKIYGSPWQPRFFDWAFNLDEVDLTEKWDQIPDDADIFLLHGPPFGYGDGARRMVKGQWTEEHVGSPSLLERIKAVKPKLAVFGHIPPAYGVYRYQETILVNASLVNNRYEPVNAPVVMEL